MRAVHDKLREFAPDKAAQYELLLADQRSVQRLMDETLNVEALVTAESAEKLLDEMRRATAKEVHDEYDLKFRRQAQRHGQQRKELDEQAAAKLLADQAAAESVLAEKENVLRVNAKRLLELEAEREHLRSEAFAARARDAARVDAAIAIVNRGTRRLERTLLFVLWGLALVAFAGSTLGIATNQYAVFGAVAVMAVIGVYQTIQETRQKPKFGFENILNTSARRSLRKRLKSLHLDEHAYEAALKIEYGRVGWKEGAREQVIALPHPLAVSLASEGG